MIKVEVELRLLAPSRYWLRAEVMACLNLLKTITAIQGRTFLLPTECQSRSSFSHTQKSSLFKVGCSFKGLNNVVWKKPPEKTIGLQLDRASLHKAKLCARHGETMTFLLPI